MSRSLVLLTLLAIVYGKLHKQIDEYNPEASVEEDDLFDVGDGLLWVVSLSNDTLESVRLREGTPTELEDFLRTVLPLIQRLKLPPIETTTSKVTSTEKNVKTKHAKKFKHERDYPIKIKAKSKSVNEKHSKNVTKKQVHAETQKMEYKNITENNDSVKAEIMRSINRFMISSYEPDVSIVDSTDQTKPPIAVYFKGTYASLMVRLHETERHYVIRPPSPFPSWFIEEHEVKHDGKENYVTIPEIVMKDFYDALLQKLRVFLSIPV